MSYEAIITRLKNVRPHSNADKVALATVAGVQVVVGLDNYEDQLGVFFGDDGCLSHEMARTNNLYSKPEMNADTKKKGYFGKNARVRAQKFRGEKSYGFWTEIDTVAWTGVDTNELEDGFTFTHLNGEEVCKKYINPATLRRAQQNKQKKKNALTTSIRERFAQLKEHTDTRQLRYEIGKIPEGSILYFTEKLHGTSGRTGHIFAEIPLSSSKEWWNNYFGWLSKFKSKHRYQYVSGTRRVVLDPAQTTDGGWYSGNTFRVDIHNKIKETSLTKGITLFYEIVGFTETGTAIMPSQPIDKISDKKLHKLMKKKYGDLMTYSYGCKPDTEPEYLRYAFYVYRATMTNEDGIVVELPWAQVKQLCRMLGTKHVPDLKDPIFYNGDQEALIETVEGYLDEDSTIDAKHVIEGVCVRIETPEGDTYILKDKGFIFKVLESITKSNEQVIDVEEVEDLANSTE